MSDIEKHLNALHIRRQKMTEYIMEQDIQEDATGEGAVLRLVRGEEIEKANAGLMRSARWFIPPCPLKARDPQGECDFAALKLIRALYMAEERLYPETLAQIKDFFFCHNFESKYKSENHMLLFHVSRYLLAQKYPDEQFPVYGKSGRRLLEEDLCFVKDFLQFRARRGWAEFDSYGYMGEDIRALLTLYDFAAETELHALAEMSLNQLLLDMLADCMGPLYCGAHGRIYTGAALDQMGSRMFSVYWFYFGHPYEEAAKKHTVMELCLSEFVPASYVYDVLEQKPDTYENFESCHLHCISTEIPHKQVPQVEGSINKYTYITPHYAMGAVNFQDPYPADSDAKWYAHHQQHEWELTFPGGTDIKIFTHHPGSFGTEGEEHGYWTGDLGCCCGQFYCEKNLLLATYDIPDGQQMLINACVPLAYFEHRREGNYLFLNRRGVYVSLWFSNGYERAKDGAYIERELRSYGRRHAVICEVGLETEYGGFSSFIKAITEKEIHFDEAEMILAYDKFQIAHGVRKREGKDISFPYPTFSSPFLYEAVGSGVIQVHTAQAEIEMDFNRIAIKSIKNK